MRIIKTKALNLKRLVVIGLAAGAIGLYVHARPAAADTVTAPGGVVGDLSVWLRADDSVVGTNPVTTWNSPEGSYNSADRRNGDTNVTLIPNGINFNPIVRFKGDSGLSGLLKSAISSNTASAFFAGMIYGTGSSDPGVILGGTPADSSTTAPGAFFFTRQGDGVGVFKNNTWVGVSGSVDKVGVFGSHITTSGLSLAYNGGAPNNASLSPSVLDIGQFQVGGMGNSQYVTADIGDILIYGADQEIGGNAALIETYLALKYGVSLGHSYYASSEGTALWDYTTNSKYNHDIAGIGRDSASGLEQKQSKSSNSDSIVTIAHGEIAPTNKNNSHTFDTNLTFQVWGNDGGNTDTWIAENAPTGYQRIARTWKVQNTGDVDSISVAFRANNPEAPIATTTTDYYLLYDSNGNGSLADETPTKLYDNGTNGDVTAGDGHYSINNIQFKNGALFTVASTGQTVNQKTIRTTGAGGQDADNVHHDDENQANNNGDGNGDGIPDAQQDSVASFKSSVSNKPVTVQVDGDCKTIKSVSVADANSLTVKDKGYEYPHGMFDYELECDKGTTNATVTLYLDQEYDQNWVSRKFNRATGKYTTVASSNVTYGTAQVGDEKVTTIKYSVTDGGPLDEDGQVNGVIVDPIGPAVKKSHWWPWITAGAVLLFVIASGVFVIIWRRLRFKRADSVEF